MNTVTIFNSHPNDAVYSQDAFKNSIGKEIPIYHELLVVGIAKIREVEVTKEGVLITCEMDADLEIDLPL